MKLTCMEANKTGSRLVEKKDQRDTRLNLKIILVISIILSFNYLLVVKAVYITNFSLLLTYNIYSIRLNFVQLYYYNRVLSKA